MSRFDAVRLDVRYAVRRLRREKTVAILAVATLAVGIGASSAIFSVTDRVLLRPLPYPRADEIVLFAQAPAVYSQSGAAVQADVAALPQFRAIGLYAEGGANVTVQESPQRIRAAAATAGLFGALGAAPLRGRVFDATETRGSKVAVIASRLWQRAFDGDPAVVGRTLRLNSQSFVVIGVMPPGFDFPNGTEAWIPPLSDRQVSEGGLRAIARLAPGVSVAGATQALRSAYRRIYGDSYDAVAPISPLRAQLVEGTRPTLLFLSALVGLLLAEACVSLAGLLLARLRGRERELIVRRALGAGRGRLVGQILTEALVTTVAGAVAGGLVAVAALRLLEASGLGLNVVSNVTRVDVRLFVVVALVSGLSGLLFSVAPALSVSRRSEAGLLRGWCGRRDRARVGACLTVWQVAFALVLLVATDCALSALGRLVHVDLGFSNERAFVLEVTLPDSRYGRQGATEAFVDQFEASMRAMPGVRHIGTTNSPPGSSADVPSTPVTLATAPIPRGEPLPPRAQLIAITPGYLDAAGIRLMAGRSFNRDDRADRPPVVILSDTAARALDADPLKVIGRQLPMGQQMWSGMQSPPSFRAEIVGVVAGVRLQGIQGPAPLQVYRPLTQSRGGSGAIGFIVEGGPWAGGAISAARDALLRLDSELPPYNLTRLGALKTRFLATERLTAALAAAFSTVALVLCVIGLYGVLAQRVTERRRDIGIRIALGAARSGLRLVIVRASAGIAAGGIACGALLSVLAFRLAAHLVPMLDRPTVGSIGGAALVLFVAAIVAAWVPARRASAVDPASVLRSE